MSIGWPSLVSIVHLAGLALAVGAASVKLALLLRCRAEPAFTSTFLRVARPITRLIIIGMIALVLSGVGWLFLGYGLTRPLIVKLVLFAAIWVLGPIIDNVVEPGFRKLAVTEGEAVTPAFANGLRRYLLWEITATALFYVIIVLWKLRG